ncbi:NAD-glutamate dehydrogenase [Caminibacter mediatlanticus TB-2]|uniref:NAD-glutamate dehydrogenase n=1 Tax=Caminibacter mediatlanticus TB-2 TaxID=391592 RepID=A0ABX5VAV3_9BACT|nr:NAD-glutamate dehydrogenase domain-containing protein [Caminibacter mediatlanticus]QCT94572.1 NAD-glutamate dehydrogenase [Caminibacter mediatlanticus TB-2]
MKINIKNNLIIIETDKFITVSDFVTILNNFKIILEDFKKENNIYELKINKIINNNEFIKILKLALNNKIPKFCKLYYLVFENLTLREINLTRAFAKYIKQLLLELSEEMVINTFIKHSNITANFVNFFLNKEDLKSFEVKDEKENKIFTLFNEIIKNITKTNYFLKKDTISFKIDTNKFKHLLFGIQPNIEMFVYHYDFNGIHLRTTKISRGGIRYSNRIYDFREEIKDLMIAQQAKNSIIIPSGAKGGFVINKKNINKEEFKSIYSKFIDALLDLIDLDKKGEDNYFVVAADRGTANMSDIANEIAIKRGYFLKDAFASGGKNGYSHKKLGITAKGALTAANEHFKKINKDIFKDELTVVGIGSMRGDVFGNGMLLNKNFKLIAAISHDEIFIDPNPNPKIAFEERKRLFENSLSWGFYDKSKISKGGGVFKKEGKIKLSNEIKSLINYDKDYILATKLVKKLLTLKVDLLYFGGIGTYVKSSDEFNLYISDKENENIRVDAKELNAFAVCEGANLAFTMKARYEYAKKGGNINLDSIDNSAGVNISDYEVNMKIILNKLVDEKKLTENYKNNILKELTDEVVKKVLTNSSLQSKYLSIKNSTKEEIINTLNILDNNDFFKREYFNLPNNDSIDLIFKNNKIIRPAHAIIMLYNKIYKKRYLLKNNLATDEKYLFEYFPKTFVKMFKKEILNHPLKKEIIATQMVK